MTLFLSLYFSGFAVAFLILHHMMGDNQDISSGNPSTDIIGSILRIGIFAITFLIAIGSWLTVFVLAWGAIENYFKQRKQCHENG